MRLLTIADAMERYGRSRTDILAIICTYRAINGNRAAQVYRGQQPLEHRGRRPQTGNRIEAFMLSPKLDLELRSKCPRNRRSMLAATLCRPEDQTQPQATG